MTEKRIDFDTPLSVDAPSDAHSWLLGFIYGCELFATWKDGTQFVGSSGWTMKDVKENVNRFIREQK